MIKESKASSRDDVDSAHGARSHRSYFLYDLFSCHVESCFCPPQHHIEVCRGGSGELAVPVHLDKEVSAPEPWLQAESIVP
ncbi:hypothetical protein GN956_G6811 [Arapaima gigas]